MTPRAVLEGFGSSLMNCVVLGRAWAPLRNPLCQFTAVSPRSYLIPVRRHAAGASGQR